jgi:hypothetical protein
MITTILLILLVIFEIWDYVLTNNRIKKENDEFTRQIDELLKTINKKEQV